MNNQTVQYEQSAFNFLLRVRYGECDAQQVVFNARYADYVDVAMTEYFREKYGGFQTLLDKGLDTQVVNLNINWQSSARFDDVLSISIVPTKVGNSSFSFLVEFTHSETHQAIANASITYVMVDNKDYTKTNIPDWIRQRLS